MKSTLLNKIIRIIDAVEYCDGLVNELNKLFFEALRSDTAAVNNKVNELIKINGLEV